LSATSNSATTCAEASNGKVVDGAVPPAGTEVDTPSHVASYSCWREIDSHGTCTIEFRTVSSGKGDNDFGKDAPYATNGFHRFGDPECVGPVKSDACEH
jgi:hypothetical protein